jgi:hypothetical protein
MAEIEIEREERLSAREYLDVLHRSGLAERRPVSDPERIAGMLDWANLVVTARRGGRLIGISRCITDLAIAATVPISPPTGPIQARASAASCWRPHVRRCIPRPRSI